MNKTGCFRQAGPIPTRRYTPWYESLSRPILGHTPRKLPRFRAISRIIADALFTRLLIIQHHPKSVKKKSKKIMSYFPQFSAVALVILSQKCQFHFSIPILCHRHLSHPSKATAPANPAGAVLCVYLHKVSRILSANRSSRSPMSGSTSASPGLLAVSSMAKCAGR